MQREPSFAFMAEEGTQGPEQSPDLFVGSQQAPHDSHQYRNHNAVVAPPMTVHTVYEDRMPSSSPVKEPHRSRHAEDHASPGASGGGNPVPGTASTATKKKAKYRHVVQQASPVLLMYPSNGCAGRVLLFSPGFIHEQDANALGALLGRFSQTARGTQGLDPVQQPDRDGHVIHGSQPSSQRQASSDQIEDSQDPSGRFGLKRKAAAVAAAGEPVKKPKGSPGPTQKNGGPAAAAAGRRPPIPMAAAAPGVGKRQPPIPTGKKRPLINNRASTDSPAKTPVMRASTAAKSRGVLAQSKLAELARKPAGPAAKPANGRTPQKPKK